MKGIKVLDLLSMQKEYTVENISLDELEYYISKYRYQFIGTDLIDLHSRLLTDVKDGGIVNELWNNREAIIKNIALKFWNSELQFLFNDNFWGKETKLKLEEFLNSTYEEIANDFITLNDCIFYIPYDYFLRSRSLII